MPHININEIERNLPAYLKRAEAGESFIITREGKPVFELRCIEKKKTEKRPFGLCRGEFHVPDDFDATLPEEMLNAFEGK